MYIVLPSEVMHPSIINNFYQNKKEKTYDMKYKNTFIYFI